MFYEIWKHLLQKELFTITFDLLYTPRAFEILLSQFPASHCPISSSSSFSFLTPNDYGMMKYYFQNELFPNHNFLYYHCGGIEGNESILKRYERKEKKEKK
jgi:1-aminocyclopropane-1-carboxylate deaminase/D-cysteine desulfhydrase-like pyridoxal-dependent ACC family enzyme